MIFAASDTISFAEKAPFVQADFTDGKNDFRFTVLAPASAVYVVADGEGPASFDVVYYNDGNRALVKLLCPDLAHCYTLPQTEATRNGMFALATLIPAIGFLISLIPMFLYDYTGKKKEAILAELEERRAAKEAQNADEAQKGTLLYAGEPVLYHS